MKNNSIFLSKNEMKNENFLPLDLFGRQHTYLEERIKFLYIFIEIN